MSENITFEQLPKMVIVLTNEIKELKELLTNIKKADSTELSEKLLTVKETATFLNLTVPTIYSKVSRGELPFMKRGKRLYFSDVELLSYLKDGRVKTNEQIEAEADAYISSKNV